MVRECGGCTVCCTVLAVDELQKSEQSPCCHANGRGCAIYAMRPEPCQAFRCYWLLGILPKELRPDKVGAMVTQFGGVFLAVYEIEPGAATHGPLSEYLAARVRKGEFIGVRTPTTWQRLEKEES